MDEIKSLTLQNNADNLPIIAELTFVLFYGFYYGVTPAENLIAESYLFELGWKPYKNQSEDGSNNLSTGLISLSDINGLKSKSNRSSNYYFWFKRVKLISRGEDMGQPSNIEFGDYQVFDLSFGKYLSNMVSNLIIICVKWNHQNIILKSCCHRCCCCCCCYSRVFYFF